MKAHQYDINYEVAEAREKEVRHDVMSHVYAFGKQAPKAEPIIRYFKIIVISHFIRNHII